MIAILNDVDNSFEGKLEVIDVAASKKEFCKYLGCKWCLKDGISVAGRVFGLVYPKERVDKGWGSISMINYTCAPEFEGSFLLFGITDTGKLVSLTQEEIDFLMGCFSQDKRENGRVKYILHHVGC